MFVDPRGIRFSAWVTVAVLALALLTGSAWVLALQAMVFGVGAFAGMRYAPYGVLFRAVVVPFVGPPTERESAAPPRFAQGVGFAFAVVGLGALVLGADVVAVLAIGAALAAAFLNAAFGFCLGCEMYLAALRMRPAAAGSPRG